MAGDDIQQRRATDNDWVAKAKAVGDFISKVGVPTVFTLTVLGLGTLIVMGKIDSPVVSNKTFLERQQWLEDAHKEQSKQLGTMVELLSEISCDQKANDKLIAQCYRDKLHK